LQKKLKMVRKRELLGNKHEPHGQRQVKGEFRLKIVWRFMDVKKKVTDLERPPEARHRDRTKAYGRHLSGGGALNQARGCSLNCTPSGWGYNAKIC